MSTLIVAAIIVGFILAICLLLRFIDRKQNKDRKKELLNHFVQSGTNNGLKLSSQEILNSGIIGLDGIQRKLLILNGHNGEFNSQVIDLDEVKTCSVKKHYTTITMGNPKNSKPEQHLEAVVLHFCFYESKLPIEIPFYSHIHDPIYQLSERDQRARYWEMILTKMLKPRAKKIS
jgi:hypothetical protein